MANKHFDNDLNQMADYIRWFRRASPYIQAHCGSTFVVCIPGEGLNEPNIDYLVQDICLLHSLGIKIVICYGAKPQIDATLANNGITSQFYEGNRVSDQNTMHYITGVSGRLRALLEAQFSVYSKSLSHHGRELSVLSGNFVVAKSMGVLQGVDMMFTGNIHRVHGKTIENLLDNNHIVLIPNIGYSSTGQAYNLSHVESGRDVALALNADKLIVLHEEDYAAPLREYSAKTALMTPHDNRGYQQKFAVVATAVDRGIKRGHLLPYTHKEGLLTELFTPIGYGTMISSSSSEVIRPATGKDIGSILNITEPLEKQGILVTRSRDYLEQTIDSFMVAEIDGTVVACVALIPYESNAGHIDTAEFSCFVVRDYYRKTGIGKRLYSEAIKTAMEQGIKTLFALTTQTAHWFVDNGWQPIPPEDLPLEKAKTYSPSRNSKIFKLKL